MAVVAGGDEHVLGRVEFRHGAADARRLAIGEAGGDDDAAAGEELPEPPADTEPALVVRVNDEHHAAGRRQVLDGTNDHRLVANGNQRLRHWVPGVGEPLSQPGHGHDQLHAHVPGAKSANVNRSTSSGRSTNRPNLRVRIIVTGPRWGKTSFAHCGSGTPRVEPTRARRTPLCVQVTVWPSGVKCSSANRRTRSSTSAEFSPPGNLGSSPRCQASNTAGKLTSASAIE